MTVTINGKPVETSGQAQEVKDEKAMGINAKATSQGVEVDIPGAPAVKPTHKKECGIVGETGDHGDLGTNAA